MGLPDNLLVSVLSSSQMPLLKQHVAYVRWQHISIPPGLHEIGVDTASPCLGSLATAWPPRPPAE